MVYFHSKQREKRWQPMYLRPSPSIKKHAPGKRHRPPVESHETWEAPNGPPARWLRFQLAFLEDATL